MTFTESNIKASLSVLHMYMYMYYYIYSIAPVHGHLIRGSNIVLALNVLYMYILLRFHEDLSPYGSSGNH